MSVAKLENQQSASFPNEMVNDEEEEVEEKVCGVCLCVGLRVVVFFSLCSFCLLFVGRRCKSFSAAFALMSSSSFSYTVHTRSLCRCFGVARCV